MKKSKLFALLLTLTLIFALFAGCNNNAGPSSQPSAAPASSAAPGTDAPPEGNGSFFPLAETFEFSMWTNIYDGNLKWMTDLNGHPVHQELERLTNVHVNFSHPVQGSQSEAFNLMIATGDYPDVIQTQYNQRGVGELFYQGHIIDLVGYINEYMPNYKGLLDADSMLRRDVTLDTGEMVAVYTVVDPISVPWLGLGLRSDLLNELGLKLPETVSDWETVLTGFRDLGVEKPLIICQNGSTSYFGGGFEPAFGVGTRLYRDGAAVKYAPIEPGYREYIENMRDWYGKGLIDREFMAPTDMMQGMLGVTSDADLNNGVAGAGNMQSDRLAAQLVDAGTTLIESMYITGVPWPVMNAGDPQDYSRTAGSGRASTPYGVTTNCAAEKIETILRYFDYLYSEETHLLVNYGIEGVSWSYDANGVPQYTEMINAGAANGVDVFHPYDYSIFGLPIWFLDKELIQGRPQEILDMQMSWVVDPDVSMGVLPTLTLSEAEQGTVSSILNDLNTYADEMTVKFITGAESMDKYGSFLDTFERMGIGQVLSAEQAAYDRYLAR
ncbi:MAG: hypothetical protein LBL09_04870 [Oscillospiraceae bacterium]|jgi:putative aldouronate transport system substrate-binding protein|nr:hypothetical protein [Oscillospiraceae bacterium]